PKLSFLAQVCHLIVLIPACIISAKYGFWALVYTRSIVRLQLVLVHFIIMKFVIKFPIGLMLKNVVSTASASILMGIIGLFVKNLSDSLSWSFVSIILCALLYFIFIFIFPDTRKDIIN